jgi:hypothetical protein
MREKRKILAEDNADRCTVEGWVCKTCGRFWGDDERMARYCCATDFPCACGGRHGKGYTCCDDCRAKLDEERHQERLEKATEVEYTGPFFVGDDLFFSVDDYLEDCECQSSTPVEWAFVPIKRVLSLNVDDVVDNVVEDLCSGLDDSIDPDGMDEFRAAVDRFNEANRENFVWEEAHAQKFRVTS